MAWSRVVSFDDPSACAAAFHTADVELFPTAKGSFHAEVTQIGMNGLLMQRIHVSLPGINTVAVKPGRRSFGFLTESNSSTLLDRGLEVLPGDIVVHSPDVVHQRSAAHLHYSTVSLPLDELAAAAEAMFGHELPDAPSKFTIRPASPLMHRLLSVHKGIGQLAHDTPDILVRPEVGRALENELKHITLRCVAEGVAMEPSASSRRRERILARFEEVLEASLDRPLYLTEICAAIGVAERTLRASCEEHLGMGPIRYLTLRRMHLARRALLRSDSSKATVTQIATDHGFWELGRFSVAYHTLFGEPPSETLRRPAEQLDAWINRPSSLEATRVWATST
jgi:AraC-like DNA-binding protein